MLNFLARRVVQLVPTLFFVSLLIFSLQHLLPGDPALVMAGEERDPAVIEQIRQQYDEPSLARCLSNLFQRRNQIGRFACRCPF